MGILTKRRIYTIPIRPPSVLLSTGNLHLSLSWVRRPLHQVLGVEKVNNKGLKETATKIENAAVNITPQTSQVCLSYNKGVKIKRICVLDYPHEWCGCKMHCGNHLSIQELSTAAPIRRLWCILKPSQMCSKNLPLQVTALKVMSKKSQG